MFKRYYTKTEQAAYTAMATGVFASDEDIKASRKILVDTETEFSAVNFAQKLAKAAESKLSALELKDLLPYALQKAKAVLDVNTKQNEDQFEATMLAYHKIKAAERADESDEGGNQD
jgi:hypothetical protein